MIDLHPTQQEAVKFSISRSFSIITGGAGTGKTTIINSIAKSLEANGESVSLCAFAGKAAARLKEVTGYEASTIHRLLGFNGTGFQKTPFNDRAIVVDESSMVDSILVAEIIKRRPKRLILVGDEAQLSPVGRGQPFHDLIKLKSNSVFNLTICFRQSEAVYQAATAIRAGLRPQMQETSSSESWEIRATGEAARTHAAILDLVRFGYLDFQKDIVLCPRNGESPETLCSVKGLNKDIVDIVNPRTSNERFVVGDRVINTKNVADKEVWNGTTGTVHAIDNDGQVWIELDTPTADGETRILFTKKMTRDLQLAYALTVHKSQGSQYRRVVLVSLNQDAYMLLNRALIYTGITRTKSECLVVGQPQSFFNGIQKVNHKKTVLQELAK